jgi:hypothetical protein
VGPLTSQHYLASEEVMKTFMDSLTTTASRP